MQLATEEELMTDWQEESRKPVVGEYATEEEEGAKGSINTITGRQGNAQKKADSTDDQAQKRTDSTDDETGKEKKRRQCHDRSKGAGVREADDL